MPIAARSITTMAATASETPVLKSRKRKRKTETWKRNVAKKNNGFGFVSDIAQRDFQLCLPVDMQLRAVFRFISHQCRMYEEYIKNTMPTQTLKFKKKNCILQHVAVSSAKRNRLPECQSILQVCTCYLLPRQRQGITEHVKVCRKAFLGVVNESRDRVQRLCQMYLQLGVTPPETRGGVRQVEKYELKRTAVKEFVKKCQPIQSHYCTGKNTARQYLRSQLNVEKMWEMYLEKQICELNMSFFKTIFNENFNISLDAPYTDKCSTCTSLEKKLNYEGDKTVKHYLQIDVLVHKKRVDTFYQKLREKSDSELVLTYDCQKNLILPKLSDQVFQYPQNKNNKYIYVWTEDAYSKGSNQMSSSLHHRLNKLNLDEVTTIRLFSDGCGGQNKNQTIIGMLSHWMLSEAPKHLKDIVLLSPTVGNSYVLPDRVFVHLERYFRHESIIENPEKSLQVFNQFGTVTNLEKDYAVSDCKLYSQEIFKPPGKWHFQF
ncbi:hypothetical protein PR048_018106 [Dryococelus australis]|uniref:Uncharacterized protein n=1 Tax=Dryococelus australis TaxID=614101 RepID=A0ABQ9HBI7_9NEOP|nr:hypothetical protein PR048_018106 [Dryococelus australis]